MTRASKPWRDSSGAAPACGRGRRSRHPPAATAPAGAAPARRLLLAAALAAAPSWAQSEPEEVPRKLEGAVGLVLTYSPEYAGAGANAWRLVPAGFVRYGRLSLSGSGGFSTRRNDDVERGAAASLMERDTLRVSVGLSADSGRRESSSPRLQGMGDIDGTLRASLRLRWRPERNWSVTTALSVDALGQGSGWWLQGAGTRSWQLAPDTSMSAGVSMRWAGSTYLQKRYGVTAAQSANAGYPVYVPGSGLTDLGVELRLRTELGPRWAAFISAGGSWQLGPAARSPLVERRFGASVGSGLVWRF